MLSIYKRRGAGMKSKLLLLLAASMLAPGAAMAALYKCGTVYQDRPCDNGQPQQQLRPSGGTVSAPAPVLTSAPKPRTSSGLSCGESAEQAQRIAWKRDSGVKREVVAAELKNRRNAAELLALVDEVYTQKVPAADIRRQREQQCTQGLQAAKP